MDFNDIKSRLERLYASINARFDENIGKHINITNGTKDGRKFVRLTFDKDSEGSLNKILLIIHNLANLKDHLKKVLSSKGGNKEDIENEINDSLSLQLIIDLSNAEKHGYPTNRRRSQLDPQIRRIRHSMAAKGKTAFSITFPSGEYKAEGDCKIVIDADIVNEKEELIMGLDQLINSGLLKWEELIKKYDIA